MLTLVGIYLSISLLSLLLAALLLDPVPPHLQDPVPVDTSGAWGETLELVTATARLLTKPPLLLLIPLYVSPGMDFAFFHSDWARVSV